MTISAPPSLTPGQEIVEFGTQSMKFHSRNNSKAKKIPYRLGHDVFTEGRISPQTVSLIARAVEARRRKPTSSLATSAVRHANNQTEFVHYMRDQVGLGVRVLSEGEEAAYLAQSYLQHYPGQVPALLSDLGGGSLELVYLPKSGQPLWISLPIGAIRMYHLGLNAGLPWNADFVKGAITSQFANLVLPTTNRVYAVGGTIRAIAKTLRKTRIARAELWRLGEVVERYGPPPDLKPERAIVFLPGLMVLRYLLDFVLGTELVYLTDVSVGEAMFCTTPLNNRWATPPRYTRRVLQRSSVLWPDSESS